MVAEAKGPYSYGHQEMVEDIQTLAIATAIQIVYSHFRSLVPLKVDINHGI